MKIGTVMLGKIHNYKDQYIATKFFILGIPLFPIDSYFFVAPERGLQMHSLHGKSVLKGYLSFLTLILGIFGLMWKPLLGLILLGISIYLFWFFATPTDEEKKERDLFALATGVNATPDLLDNVTALTMRNNITQQIRMTDPLVTVEGLASAIADRKFDSKGLPLMFAFMAYHNKLVGGKFDGLVQQLRKEFMQQLGMSDLNEKLIQRK